MEQSPSGVSEKSAAESPKKSPGLQKTSGDPERPEDRSAHQVLQDILSRGGLKPSEIATLSTYHVPKVSQAETLPGTGPGLVRSPVGILKIRQPNESASVADGSATPAPGTLLQAEFLRPDPRGAKARNAPTTASLMDLPVPRFAEDRRKSKYSSYHDLSDSDCDFSEGSFSDSESDPDDWYPMEDPWEAPKQKPLQSGI